LGLKAAKHSAWVAIALWTGFTFIGYFTPIRSLAGEVVSGALGPWQTFWILFYGFATWGNAGFMREQVCKYMCPYARFQSAMFDKDTLIITYDADRGDPRGTRGRKADPKALGLGDCIDCGLCVEVCPTGIDIRDGLQYECIGCASCIDACDRVMDKMGYPRGLVRYDTENGLKNHWNRDRLLHRVLRPRVIVYMSILALVTVALFTHMALRTPFKVDVIRDRGALGREVEDGMIENVYRLQFINSAEVPKRFVISVGGLDTLFVDSEKEIEVAAAGNRLVAVRVRLKPGHGHAGTNPVFFEIHARSDPSTSVREKSTFYIPR
ncbi:MAG: cytochrome c oxidase accessory protein CcoG, partial [Burkholderiaceae bacterium]|nr:cytochrome c oxidase accessory protein CcoG [Burkholderiaceae bacterium]